LDPGEYPSLEDLVYTDDGNITGPFSKNTKYLRPSQNSGGDKLIYKQDDNLDFNISKTKILAKGYHNTFLIGLNISFRQSHDT
jgi:hypothetical protein